MAITEKELIELMAVQVGTERLSTISSDGRNLLTRIPKQVCEKLNLEKGNKIRWLVTSEKKIKLEIIKNQDYRNKKK